MIIFRCHIADADAGIAISDFQMTLWKLRWKFQLRRPEVRKPVSRRARLSQRAIPTANQRRGQRLWLTMVTAILLASAFRASPSQLRRRAARRQSNRQQCGSNQFMRRTYGGQQSATLKRGDDCHQPLLLSMLVHYMIAHVYVFDLSSTYCLSRYITAVPGVGSIVDHGILRVLMRAGGKGPLGCRSIS